MSPLSEQQKAEIVSIIHKISPDFGLSLNPLHDAVLAHPQDIIGIDANNILGSILNEIDRTNLIIQTKIEQKKIDNGGIK